MDTKPIRPGVPDLQQTLANQADKTSKQKSATPSESHFEKNFDVNLSKEAQSIVDAKNNAMQIAKATSPIREDRVAALKAQIDSGAYKIDSGRIADGIMVEAIKDSIASKHEV